jgi:hypothetical protein
MVGVRGFEPPAPASRKQCLGVAEGRQRWHKIGRHGAPWTPEKAREEAVCILGNIAEGRRERRLSDDEYAALGAAPRQGAPQGIWPAAIAMTQFLALTGWRIGTRSRPATPIPAAASGRCRIPPVTCCARCAISSRAGERSRQREATARWSASRNSWISKLGGLPADITPHVLRHSFAGLAGDIGYSEPTIAALEMENFPEISSVPTSVKLQDLADCSRQCRKRICFGMTQTKK